jgi:hypothetical protein
MNLRRSFESQPASTQARQMAFWKRVSSNVQFSRRLTGLLILSAVSAAQIAGARDVLIQNVTLISPERATPMLHADVLLENGRIAKIGTKLLGGPNFRRIDGSGRFLIPGLIDSHVHAGHSAALAAPPRWMNIAMPPRRPVSNDCSPPPLKGPTPHCRSCYEIT